MNRSLHAVCDSVRKAWQPVGDALHLARLVRRDTIVDHYKGMRIHIRARRFGNDAWTCSIRIGNAPHRALRSLRATVRSTEAGISLNAALAFAFTEAMSLCDLLLERGRAQ